MSMLTIRGRLIHIFEKPPVKRGDETIDAKPQIQLLGEYPLLNGESRFDLVTLTCENPKDYEQFLNEIISVPVGVFAPGKNQLIHFIPKGSKPLQA
jgi:hypothetical protein